MEAIEKAKPSMIKLTDGSMDFLVSNKVLVLSEHENLASRACAVCV